MLYSSLCLYVGVEFLGHMVILHLNCFQKLTDFSKDLYHFTFQPGVCEGSDVSTSLKTRYYLFFLLQPSQWVCSCVLFWFGAVLLIAYVNVSEIMNLFLELLPLTSSSMKVYFQTTMGQSVIDNYGGINLIQQCFSNCNVRTDHLRIL